MMMWRHIPAKSNTTFTSRKTSRDNKFQCRNDPLCREGIYLAFINKFRTNYRIDQTQYVLYYVTASFIRANEMYCLDCRYVERLLYQYCEMDTDSAYIALAGESIDDLVTSEHQSITLNTDRNGSRPSAATIIKTTTSTLVSLDAHGRLPNRVAWHARPSINEHRGYLRSSGVATVSLVSVVKHITVSVQPTSAQLKA